MDVSTAKRISVGSTMDVIIIISALIELLSSTMDAINKFSAPFKPFEFNNGCNYYIIIFVPFEPFEFNNGCDYYSINGSITTIILWLVYLLKAFIDSIHWQYLFHSNCWSWQWMPLFHFHSNHWARQWMLILLFPNHWFQAIGHDRRYYYFISIWITGLDG